MASRLGHRREPQKLHKLPKPQKLLAIPLLSGLFCLARTALEFKN